MESRACWIKYMEPFFHDLVDDILMTSKLAGSQDFDFKGYRDSPEICLRFSVTMGFACGNLWFRWSSRHGAATGQPEKVGTQPQCVLSLWVGLIKINEEWHILYTDIQSSNPCWSLPCEDIKISWSCTGTFAFFDVLLRMMVKIHRCNSFLHPNLLGARGACFLNPLETHVVWLPRLCQLSGATRQAGKLSQREFGRNVWRVKMGISYRDVMGINKQQNRNSECHSVSSNRIGWLSTNINW